MSFPLLDDVERLEADAARIRVQASVLKIKETAYKCRRDANRAIQLGSWEGALNTRMRIVILTLLYIIIL